TPPRAAPGSGLPLQGAAVGLGGIERRWQPVARRVFEPFVSLGEIGLPAGGVRYARAQVRAAEARPAYLVLATGGSIAAWWNRDEVARRDLATDGRTAIPPIPVVVRSGWNYLLVKIEGEPAWVGARLVDEAGDPIPGLEAESELVERPLGAAPEEIVAPPPFRTDESRASDLLESSDDADLLSLRGWLRISGDRPSQGLADLRRASAMAPARGDLSWLLAEATLSVRYLPETEQKSRVRDAVDATIAAAPGHVPAWLARADLLARDDRIEDAIVAADVAAVRNPRSAAPDLRKAGWFERMRWPAERARALGAAARHAPRNPEVCLALANEARGAGDHVREREWLDAAAAIDASHPGIADRRVDQWIRTSQGALAIAERERALRMRPDSREAKSELADALEAVGRAGEALQLRRAIAARFRNDPEAWIAVADRARDLGEADWLTAYEAAVAAAPGHESARRHLREAMRASGRTLPGDEVFDRWRGDVDAAIRGYVAAPDHAKAPDVLVLDLQVERLYPDGGTEAEITSVYRINDARGVERQAKARFRGELLELRVVHPDGTVDEPTPAHGDYQLPNLSPGDFTVLRFRIADEIRPGANPLLGRFRFQNLESPFVFSRYVLALPRSSPVRLDERNFDGTHEVIEGRDEIVHVYTRQNGPRILPEKFAPDPLRFLPTVRAGTDATSEQMNRFYRAVLLSEMEPYEEIREAADQTIAQAGAKTDREKAKALYAFVNDRVIERSQGNAIRGLLERKGNPVALYGALLRAAGVPFELAMARAVSPAADDEPEPDFLEPGRYPAPLVRVRPRDASDAPVWVDLASRLEPFGAIPAVLSGAEVFVTGAAGGSLENLPPQPDEASSDGEIDAEVSLDSGNAARVSVDITLRNAQAWQLREGLRDASADERRNAATQFANGIANGIELSSFDFPTLGDVDAPLRLHVEGRVSNFVRAGAGGLEAPALFRPILLAHEFHDRAVRKLPFRFRETLYLRERVKLLPSPDVRFGDPPPAVVRKEALASYSLRIARSGDALEVERLLVVRPGEVAPAAYPAFLQTCRTIEEAEQTKIPVLTR
ncbi:MAG TPA: hypothetical protein VKE69_04680, partial [Planctomycetota bacterium]|nr:hypothetical protein [Planctomycetota bacterium]